MKTISSGTHPEILGNGDWLDRATPEQREKYRKLRAIAEESATLLVEKTRFTDADLYDDDGIPA